MKLSTRSQANTGSNLTNHTRQLAKLALPLTAGMLAPLLIGIADVLLVGHVSDAALPAVAFGITLYMFAVTSSQAIAITHQVVVLRPLGDDNRLLASYLLWRSLGIVLITSLTWVALILAFASPLAELMLSSPASKAEAVAWISVRAWGLPAVSVAMVLSVHLQASLKPIYSVVNSITSNTLNVVASAFLIYGFGMLPALGVQGSAYGSILAEAFSVTFMVITYAFLRPISSPGSCWRNVIRIDLPRDYRPILVSEFGNVISLNTSEVAFVAILAVVGDAALGAGQVAITVMDVLTALAIAGATAFQILEGRDGGPGTSLFSWRPHVLILVIFILLGALLGTFTQTVASWFTDGSLASLTASGLVLVAVSSPLIWLSAQSAAYLRAWRRSRTVLVATTLAAWAVQVPLAFLLGIVLDLGLTGALIAYVGYHLVRVLIQGLAISRLVRVTAEAGNP